MFNYLLHPPPQVSDAAQLLVTWEKEVANLRAEYEQLLYFSVPKLLHLYQGLTAHQPNLTAVVQDVSFLFENKPHVQAQLRNSVKVCVVCEAVRRVWVWPLHVNVQLQKIYERQQIFLDCLHNYVVLQLPSNKFFLPTFVIILYLQDLLEAQSHLKEDRTRSTPMHVVGAFLKSLLTNLDLSNNSLKRRRRGSVSSTVSRSSSSGQSTHILHSCAGM